MPQALNIIGTNTLVTGSTPQTRSFLYYFPSRLGLRKTNDVHLKSIVLGLLNSLVSPLGSQGRMTAAWWQVGTGGRGKVERYSFICTWVQTAGEGNGNPLQYSCLENLRDRGAWWAAIYGVTQSWTWLKQLSSSSIWINLWVYWASLRAQLVKNPPAMQETLVWFLGWEDSPEKGKATHSSILAWIIPWTV